MRAIDCRRSCLPLLLLVAACSGGGSGSDDLASPDQPAIAWTEVQTAAELKQCMEDAATPHCLLTQSIEFAGNQTALFLELELPDDTLSHLRCEAGVEIAWDNRDGVPATAVNVVRMNLSQGEQVLIEECRVATRVNGDPKVGYPTSVQLFYARHSGVLPTAVSDVTIRGGSYETAYTGSSTIALGCNCHGPSRWNLEGVHAAAPIALDAKGSSYDGTPLPWRIVDSVLTAIAYDHGTPRCWKQLDDVTFVDLSGTVCEGGQLQFATLIDGSPHTQLLSGLTLRDTPMPAILEGAMITLAAPHDLRGTVRVEGAPGQGDPTDTRSQNLILANSTGAIDLSVEFRDCHRVFSFGSPADFALDLRPGGRLGSPIQIEFVGPDDCPHPPRIFDHQFEPGFDFLNGDSLTVNAIRASEVDGFVRTGWAESSFTLVDGEVVPHEGSANPAGSLGARLAQPFDASTPRTPGAGPADGPAPQQVPMIPGASALLASYGLFLGIGLRFLGAPRTAWQRTLPYASPASTLRRRLRFGAYARSSRPESWKRSSAVS